MTSGVSPIPTLHFPFPDYQCSSETSPCSASPPPSTCPTSTTTSPSAPSRPSAASSCPRAASSRPPAARPGPPTELGSAHVFTPVTNVHLVSRLMPEKKNINTTTATHTYVPH